MMQILFLKAEAATAWTKPTEAQAKAGNYYKPRVQWNGLEIAIENPAGSVREGKGWRTKMVNDYGYVCGSEGVDGDEVDVYLGPKLDDATMVYVVHQRKYGNWDAYDEDKVMLGFASEDEAKAAYLKHYDDPRFLGPITAMPVEEFVAKVRATKDKPAMIKAIFLKTHVAAYTKKDGTVVAPHEDKRRRANTKTVAGTDDVLRRHIAAMGLSVDETKRSGMSASRYIEVSHGIGPKNSDGEHDDYRTYKLRISDHKLPAIHKLHNSEADFEVSPDNMGHEDTHGNWHQALAWLSEKSGAPLKGHAKRVHEDWLAMERAAKARREKEEKDAQVRYQQKLGGEVEVINRFDRWLSDLPVNAELKVSNSGSLSAFMDGNLVSSFGQKPAGYSKHMNNKSEANRFVEGKRWEFGRALKESTPATREKPTITKSTAPTILFFKSYVGPYLRGGKIVNARGYQGRSAQAQAQPGQMSLFGGPESGKPLPPSPLKGKDPVAHTPDMFDTVTEPRAKLVKEHERLVDVLNSPSHADDKVEAKKQAAELAEMKEDAEPPLDIPGAKWRRGKGLIAGHYGVEVDGSVVGNYHAKPEDAVAQAKEWLANRAFAAKEKAAHEEKVGQLRERLLAGGEVTDGDLKLLGLKDGSSGLEWFIPAAAKVFGINSRAVRPHIKDLIRVGRTDMGAKKEFVSPKKALQALAVGIKPNATYNAAVTSTKEGPTDDNPRRKFYVTIARAGTGVGKLAGPFDTHDEAKAHVDRARKLAEEADPRAAFDAFGTVGVESDEHKPGVLNERLGIGEKPAQKMLVMNPKVSEKPNSQIKNDQGNSNLSNNAPVGNEKEQKMIEFKTKSGVEIKLSMDVLESGKPVARMTAGGEPVEYTALFDHPQAGLVIRAGGKMFSIDPSAVSKVKEFDRAYTKAKQGDAKRAYAELYGHDYDDSFEARRIAANRAVERVGGGDSV